MKKLLSLILAAALAAALLAGCSDSGAPSGGGTPDAGTPDAGTTTPATEPAAEPSGEHVELMVATWGGTTGAALKEIVAPFEEANNCTIVIDETAGNADRLNRIRAQKAAPEIDVVFLNDSFAVMGNEEGLFAPIDTSIVDNLDQLYDFAIVDEGYGPAYSLTSYGIMYNADTVENPPKSYRELFEGDYAGRVAMPDMTGTAGPMIAVALVEELGGSQEDITPAIDFMAEHKENIGIFYASGSDVINAFSTGECDIAVFMDMFLPILQASGVNVQWSDASEGNFSNMTTINVVEGCPHPELAQKLVRYMLEPETQALVAQKVNEAPVNKNATISDEQDAYMVYGEEEAANLRTFDFSYINSVKPEWIELFQRQVTTK